MNWTDDRVEILKKLWSEGLSASQIAAELGGISRNSVIGKVHRLGLSGRAKNASSGLPRQRKPRAAAHMMRMSRPGIRGNTALAPLHAYEIDLEPRARADREHHPDRAALLDPRVDRQQMPLADRRSEFGRVLFLRRQDHRGPALLRLSLAHRLPAVRRSPPRETGVARLGSAAFASVEAGFEPAYHRFAGRGRDAAPSAPSARGEPRTVDAPAPRGAGDPALPVALASLGSLRRP